MLPTFPRWRVKRRAEDKKVSLFSTAQCEFMQLLVTGHGLYGCCTFDRWVSYVLNCSVNSRCFSLTRISLRVDFFRFSDRLSYVAFSSLFLYIRVGISNMVITIFVAFYHFA